MSQLAMNYLALRLLCHLPLLEARCCEKNSALEVKTARLLAPNDFAHLGGFTRKNRGLANQKIRLTYFSFKRWNTSDAFGLAVWVVLRYLLVSYQEATCAKAIAEVYVRGASYHAGAGGYGPRCL